MTEPSRCKDWAYQSLQVPWMAGARGPAAFASAVCGSFDEGSEAVYRGLCLRYPYGSFTRAACKAVNARVFPAAADEQRLAAIGSTFQIPRIETETGAEYEERLGLAWAIHSDGGTVGAIHRALFSYGFPEVTVLEECYNQVLPDGADYSWAFVVVLGPDYGDVGITGMALDDFSLGEEDAYLGTGNFSTAKIDELIRLILVARQVFDCPWSILFRFGDVPLLGMIDLDDFYLDGSFGADVAVAPIQQAFALDEFVLGEETLDGFGV